jgi:2,4-dichlorophenol 6-monooxygenase
VGDSATRLSTHDLAPMTRFTLITGITGGTWEAAAEKVGGELGIALVAVVIGPGRDVTDLYFDWARLREVSESGAILVRPDTHVGWRADTLPVDPVGALRSAMTKILGRG